MNALICGFFAYDTVMVFNEKFKHHILLDNMQTLDAHFTLPDLRREFSGCAGNIAYNLKLLGGSPLPMATVGTDFAPYAERLEHLNIPRDCITAVDHSYTAQRFISLDMDDNRITAFHPGAMTFSNTNRISKAKDVKLGTISLDNIDAMRIHALQYTEANTPFIFDPAHYIFEFDGDDLLKFIEQAAWILVDEKECKYMEQQTGLNPQQIAQRVDALIIMQGANGATVFAEGARYQIPHPPVRAMNDINACRDAFCAGVLYGLSKEADWETTGRIATLLWAIKVEHHGAQNHTFTNEIFKTRFKKSFGYALII
ncbi:sugar kinase, ribokinase [Beggiatoa alba B18LD]|uniref:Sugar kinase, ribokinase n=1 Tax=Beggiatoa alba B18LD TaxID=395493 RepID=I3CL38_9GAMM|nr:carbohydrate kinase family protein [Beggiatoa alba]EIJ44331.1 sugar kinase, ribokinase [Beggiatoa alba B18LD]